MTEAVLDRVVSTRLSARWMRALGAQEEYLQKVIVRLSIVVRFVGDAIGMEFERA